MSWLGILLTFSLVENVVFARLLGLDAASGVVAGTRRAAASGAAASFLAAATAAAAWALRVYALAPIGATWLQVPAVILLAAGIAALARVVLRIAAPRTADLVGPVLRPSGAAVAALGTVLVAVRAEFTLVDGLVAGVVAGVGLLVALSILAGIEDRLGPGEAPSAMSGLPRALVSAGLAALAFGAFDRVFLAGLVR
jgi:Na+-translocating ferredoxin:NAD+ oxidoreductase RnfA subunit